MSKSQLKYPGHPISRAKAHALKDSAIMSLKDFYRIKENSIIPSSSSSVNRINRSSFPTQTISSEDTTQDFMDRALQHKNKIIEYDKSNRQYNPLFTYENQKITDPFTVVNKDDDALKELNILWKNVKMPL